ncbi:short-chain dehydrogenase [Cytophagales bacterium WSM2-2]|nr:short-chain dehydrogenase [Cytophagales bacterium WSM2-2]
MSSKIILVTGSSKGIGFEIVHQLSRLGHTAILSARNETKGLKSSKQLTDEKLQARFIHLDVTDSESVEKAYQKIKSEFGKLDVLINNAAILMKEDRSLSKNTSDVTESILNNNAYAQLRISQTLLPLIPRGGRIIMTSSQGGSMTDPVGGWSPAYCISKSLLNAMTRHLASELAQREIAVNAYDPGWVRTDMGGGSAPRSVEQGADTAVWLATADRIATGKFFRDRREISW